MNDTILKIARYLKTQSPPLRSHFFRNRKLLETPCSKIQIQTWAQTPAEMNLLNRECAFGPLFINDGETHEDRKTIRLWRKKLPHDPKFFRFLKNQIEIWRRFSNLHLRDFLESPEGRRWYQRRCRLLRKPLFELDGPYKVSKRSALAHDLKIRGLLKKYPLLRWDDLRELGIKNAQSIVQRFPQQAIYRSTYLKSLRSQIESE